MRIALLRLLHRTRSHMTGSGFLARNCRALFEASEIDVDYRCT